VPTTEAEAAAVPATTVPPAATAAARECRGRGQGRRAQRGRGRKSENRLAQHGTSPLVCACASRNYPWVTTPPFLVHAAESENSAGNALRIEYIEELSAWIRQGRDLCHTVRRAFRALAGMVNEGYKPARFHAACEPHASTTRQRTIRWRSSVRFRSSNPMQPAAT